MFLNLNLKLLGLNTYLYWQELEAIPPYTKGVLHLNLHYTYGKVDIYDNMISRSHIIEYLWQVVMSCTLPFKNMLLMVAGQFLIPPFPYGSRKWLI